MSNQDIINEYTSGVSRRVLSKKYHIRSEVIKKILINNNIEIRTVKDNSKLYSCNERFFNEIDCEDKAYWLGFIYADGCITKNKLAIRLSSKDKEHLFKFKQSINANHPIHDYPCTHGFSKKGSYSSNLCIISQNIVDDLMKHGVFYKKSLVLKFPVLNNNLVRHFIRGYFDGDGSIMCAHYSRCKGGEKKYIRGVINICGTFSFLEDLRKHLPCNCNIYKEKRNVNDTWSLKGASMKMVYELYDYFYSDTTIYLDRKKEKFEEIIKYYNIKI